MDLGLRDQTAVVVGGANGIGRAIAAQFARQGAAVVIADVDPRSADTAQQVQTETSGNVTSCIFDASDFEAVSEAASKLVAAHGTWQHVVCASGMGSGKYGFPFWNLDPADWRRVVEVNLLGAVHVAHAFCPELVRQKRGTVLFLSSVAGQIGSQTDPPYSAAKAGLINFAQCAARDLAAHDVRVNTICPGMVKTQLNESVWRAQQEMSGATEETYEQWAKAKIQRIAPLGRWQTCDDIANMAVFLASDRARNVTGQTLNVDGGQVMHA